MNTAPLRSMLQSQAARRALLLSCLPLLATACGSYDPAEPVSFEGSSVRLSARAVQQSRRLALEVIAKEASTLSLQDVPRQSLGEGDDVPPADIPAKDIELELVSLTFQVHHSWNGLSARESAARPWFRVQLVDERDDRIVAERTVVAGDDRGDVHPIVLGAPPLEVCTDTKRCEATFRLEFERQRLEFGSQEPPSESTLSATWSAIANAEAKNAPGNRLAVTLSEL